MLGYGRRLWILTTAALIAAGGAATPSLAQSGQGGAGLNSRLDEAEAKLADDIKACRPINADDYQPLVDEMKRNLNTGTKAARSGVPVDVDRLLSDADRATNLMSRARAAQAAQSNACPPKQAQMQPQPSQVPTTGGVSPTPRPSEPGVSKNDEQEVARQQRTIDNFESALNELEGLIKAGKCAEAWDLADDLDDWLDELDNPDPKRPAAFGGPTPKVPPRLIDEWDQRIEDMLKKCPQPGKINFGMIAPILDTHNAERAQYGYDPVRWSLKLSDHAQAYSDELARTGQLVHAPREGRGVERENLQQGLPGWSTERRIQEWLKEKSNFVPGDFPNVARDGNLNSVLHYTQVIWPDTKAIGCGMTLGGGFDWFVCRYSPGGNKDGKPIGMPITIASNPAPTSYSVDGSHFQTTGKIDHDFKYGFAYRNTPISSESAWDQGAFLDSGAVPSLTNVGAISVLPTPAPLTVISSIDSGGHLWSDLNTDLFVGDSIGHVHRRSAIAYFDVSPSTCWAFICGARVNAQGYIGSWNNDVVFGPSGGETPGPGVQFALDAGDPLGSMDKRIQQWALSGDGGLAPTAGGLLLVTDSVSDLLDGAAPTPPDIDLVKDVTQEPANPGQQPPPQPEQPKPIDPM